MRQKLLMATTCALTALSMGSGGANAMDIWLQGPDSRVSIGGCTTARVDVTPGEVIFKVTDVGCLSNAETEEPKPGPGTIGLGTLAISLQGPNEKVSVGQCKTDRARVTRREVVFEVKDIGCRSSEPPVEPEPILGCGPDIAAANCFPGKSYENVYVRSQFDWQDKSIKDGEVYVVWFDPYAGGPDVYQINQTYSSFLGEYKVNYDAALSRIPGSFDKTLDESGNVVDIPPACTGVNKITTTVNIVDMDTLPDWKTSNVRCGLQKGANYYWNFRVHGTPGCGGGPKKKCVQVVRGWFPTQ